jgi:hypothetical protein
LESYSGKLHEPIEAMSDVLAKATSLNDDEKDALMRAFSSWTLAAYVASSLAICSDQDFSRDSRDHYVAALFLRNADGARYGPIRDALSNSFVLR